MQSCVGCVLVIVMWLAVGLIVSYLSGHPLE
jgi:hypothetical protein